MDRVYAVAVGDDTHLMKVVGFFATLDEADDFVAEAAASRVATVSVLRLPYMVEESDVELLQVLKGEGWRERRERRLADSARSR